MKILRVVVLLALPLFIFSCVKDKSKPEIKPEKIYLPVKITYDNGYGIKFEYNSSNLISRFTFDGDSDYMITYDSSNLPVKIESFYNGHLFTRYKFSFDSAGRTIRNDAYTFLNDVEDLYYYDTYTYNAKNQLSKLSTYDEKGKLSGTDDYKYDANGNIIKIADVCDITYDDKNGIFKHVRNSILYWVIDDGLYLSSLVNNAATMYFTGDHMFDRINTYEYNQDGYPIKVMSKTPFGTPIDTAIIEYKVVKGN